MVSPVTYHDLENVIQALLSITERCLKKEYKLINFKGKYTHNMGTS